MKESDPQASACGCYLCTETPGSFTAFYECYIQETVTHAALGYMLQHVLFSDGLISMKFNLPVT